MSENLKWKIHRINTFLERPQAVILTLLILFAYFVISNAEFQHSGRVLLEQTKATTQNTNAIVSKQDQTLAAIKQLALDSKLTSKQLGDTIICMLKVPQVERTDDLAAACRTQVLKEDTAQNSGAVSGSQTGTSAATPMVSTTTTPAPTQTTTAPVIVPPAVKPKTIEPTCEIKLLFLQVSCGT